MSYDDYNYFVLMGDVGGGKSTIIEKLAEKTGLSSTSRTSFTRDSKVFIVKGRKYLVADTPGLRSTKERLDHALNLLGALSFKPVKSLVFICPMKDRLDGISEYICDVISPFLDDFGDNISLIVTKYDQRSEIASKEEIIEFVQDLGIEKCFVSERSTSKLELLDFFDSFFDTATSNVDINLAPTQLPRYLNLNNTNIKMKCKFDKYVGEYKIISNMGIEHMNTLTGDERMDFVFSFKALMKDLVIDFQMEFTEEVGGDTTDPNFLLWTNELAKTMKRELLLIRTNCAKYTKVNVAHNYRKCPHCGCEYLLAEGCEGNTTCGNMPSTGDTRNQFSKFSWNWRNIISNGIDSYMRETKTSSRNSTVKSGKNPEFPKPCGKTVAFKDMVPINLPQSWNFELAETVTDVQELNVLQTTTLNNSLNNQAPKRAQIVN